MSQPWWGKEAFSPLIDRSSRKLVRGELGRRPQLHEESPAAVARQIRERRPTFAEEWHDAPDDPDAGGVLVELFGQQASSILKRVNRLPDRAFVEFLSNAGIHPEPPRPAEAMVQFTLSKAADDSVSIPEGFQIGAPPADGQGDLVVFETMHGLQAAPTGIAAILGVEGASQRNLTSANDDTDSAFLPLGQKPEIGNSLVIGLEAGTSPSGSITLGIRVHSAPGEPPPVSAGGVAPTPMPLSPVLEWSALRHARFQPMDVLLDETANLWRSGIVQLRVPRDWDAEPLFGQGPCYWFRLRLIHGGFQKPPELNFVRLNMARVRALQTIRDEVLEPIDGPDSNRLRLKNTPVVAGSVNIVVDATPFDDDPESDLRGWKEVDDLTQHGPDERVFTLEPATGVVTFGDGVHGLSVPPGFRNVRAESYQVGGGKRGAVGRDAITNLINSATFLTQATNPLPASGGVDVETHKEAVSRGPATIRSGRRAVTVNDYAVWARFVPGADVRKAHAISGFHPLFPGSPMPGVVGVLVVPSHDNTGPPIPDESALRAVSTFLSEHRAPAGVEIVAAAPNYRLIRSEIGFVPDANADVGEIIRDMTQNLDQYLHPLTGGDDERGWSFGGTLLFSVLMRRLLSLKGVRAVPRLRLIVDGVPQQRCADVPLGPTELFWAEGHQIVTVDAEEGR